MSPSRRVALALVGADLALFAFFFILAFAERSASIVVPSLALGWEVASATLRTIAWFPAAHLFASILAVASVRGETEGIVVKVAAPAVVVSALVAAAALVFGPFGESSLDGAVASSRRFAAYLETSRLDLEAGKVEEARVDLEILKSISEKDARLPPLERRLAGLEAKAAAADKRTDSPGPDPRSALAAWKKAQDFYAKGDWYNAHWQATLALRLDPSLIEAQRLAGKAWEEIARATGSTPKDEAEAAFFAEKFRGYGLLRAGDYIGAWRVFASLAKGHAEDPEVRRYLRESLAGIDRSAFYRDEADAAFFASSILRFFLRYRPSTGGERVLAAAESGWSGGAAYFRELEYLEIRADGSALLVSAPWAKVAGKRLFFLAADRSSPGSAWRPRAFAIAPGGSTAQAKPSPAPASLEFDLEVSTLSLIARARSEPATLRLTEAFTALAKTSAWGMTSEPLAAELLDRLGTPFASFGTAVIGLLLGLRFRPRSDKLKGGFPLLGLPLLALLTAGAWHLIDRLDALSSLWCARALPGTGALWLSAGFRSFFILVGVLLVVGATSAETWDRVEGGSDEA